MSERLAEIEARVEAATEGPWKQGNDAPRSSFGVWSGPLGLVCSTDSSSSDAPQAQANASFLAHARSDIPWLLERVKELREALERCCDENDYCYVCDCHGHASDCPLADSGEASGEAG
jgi:hypothetical protein